MCCAGATRTFPQLAGSKRHCQFFLPGVDDASLPHFDCLKDWSQGSSYLHVPHSDSDKKIAGAMRAPGQLDCRRLRGGRGTYRFINTVELHQHSLRPTPKSPLLPSVFWMHVL